MIGLVWAQDEKGLIGQKEGFQGMPWELPNDLKHFQEVTLQGDVVMGRTTYETLSTAPLPKRKNLILTSNEDYEAEGALVIHSIDEALEYAEKSDKPLFVTGGAIVFEQFLDKADRLYRTLIHETFEGDTYFPEVDYDQWELVKSEEGIVDEDNPYPHTFEMYERK